MEGFRAARWLLAGSVTALVAMGPVQARADDAGSAGTDKAVNENQLQDIIVTAQRRPERLQNAALAATALLGSNLIDTGKVSVDSALTQVPSVRVQSASNGGQIYIRGVGSNADSQLGDPAVNLNIDGIYQQETEAVTSGMYDLSRIEVLRGPQGTLYGRNATAGAVNIITNDPQIGETGGAYNLQYGNYQAVSADGHVNAGLSDTFAVRAAASYQNHDGYLSNGNDDANSISARLKMLWEPTSRLRVLVGGDYTHIRDNAFGTVEAPLDDSDPYYSAKPRGYRRINAWSVHADVDYDLDWATLTVLGGHTDFRKNDANVLLGDSSAVATRRTGELSSGELRLSSSEKSPIKWTVGTFYMTDDEYRAATDSPISVPADAASNPELRMATTRSYAAFANVTVPLLETLRLTGGLRYTHDRKAANFVYTDDSGSADERSATTWESVTWKAGLEADVGPNSLAYAQVSTGFKAGGYAQQYPAGTYDPEKLTAYEIGTKNDFLGKTLRVNAAAFYYTYNNYQASYPDIVGGTFALVTSNAATAKLYGGEIEINYLLTPADTLSLSGSYLHTRFGTFVYTSILSGEVDHTGERMPAAPEWGLDASYEHRFDLANGATLTAHVNSHVSSGYWTSVERTTDSYQSSFTRTDAYLAYRPASGTWTVRAFVNNLEDTAVRTLGMQNPFDAVLMLAPPRTYGVGFGVNF